MRIPILLLLLLLFTLITLFNLIAFFPFIFLTNPHYYYSRLS